MKIWQGALIVIAGVFLGIVFTVLSVPKTLTGLKNASTPNPVETFVNKFSQKETTILLTGDVMLGRSVNTVSLKKNDPTYPFLKTADRLKKADLVFSNLEAPIVSNCPKVDSGFKFCADPGMVAGLTYAGVDLVNLANNHTGNYGKEGLAQTEKYLTDAGISFVGDGNLVIKEVGGVRFGFLGFDFVTKNLSEEEISLVKESKNKADILIVATHWGVEYTGVPTGSQKKIAKTLIEAGADVVYGTHPHWVQTTDHINGKPVFYSLGNFIFDQMWSNETRRGAVITLTYHGSELKGEKEEGIYMKNFAQPEFTN